MIGIRGTGAGSSSVRAVFAAAIALLAASPAHASAAAVSPADRAATDAYLHARYEYEKATLAALPAATAEALAYARSLERECPGVLVGANGATHRTQAPTAREEGEQARRSRQNDAVLIELSRSTLATESRSLGPAETSFAEAVAPLRWSDPRIASAIARELDEAASVRVGPSRVEVCADMRMWRGSGFTQLAPRTRELREKESTEFEAPGAGPSAEVLLRRYEGRAERALVARDEALGSHGYTVAGQKLQRSYERMLAILTGKRLDVERPKQTVLGKGTTSTGARYTVTPTEPGFGHRPGCRAEVSVEYSVTEHWSGTAVIETGGGGPLCIAGRAAPRRPVLSCESGSLNLTQLLGADVRRVRLVLADGRTLTSSVVPIAARYGGPAALYVQSLGAHSSKPVSIVALAPDGGALATIPVPTHARCPTRAQEEPTSVELARGTSPVGTAFTIKGDYLTFDAHGHFNLELESRGESESQWRTVQGPPHKGLFEPSFGGGCPPAGWAIVYGVLKPPGASVVAVTASGEETLSIAAIPTRLHAGGMLAYGLFSEPPTRLVVHDAHGNTLSSEDLTAQDLHRREYCEGFAEPAQ